MTTDNQTPPQRYARLKEIIHKCFIESEKSIDTNKAVKDCYGDDADIFAGQQDDNTNNRALSTSTSNHENTTATIILANLISGVMDQINESMDEQVGYILDEQNVEQKLSRLDKVIEDMEEKERLLEKDEEEDRSSTQKILQDAKSYDLSLEDILLLQSFHVKSDMKEKLLTEIKELEKVNDQLAEEVRRKELIVREQLNSLEEVRDSLSKSADLCSFSEKK